MTDEQIIKDFFRNAKEMDKPAIREAFTIYIDNLVRDQQITEEQARNVYITDYDMYENR